MPDGTYDGVICNIVEEHDTWLLLEVAEQAPWDYAPVLGTWFSINKDDVYWDPKV